MRTSTCLVTLMLALTALGACSSRPVEDIKRIFKPSKGEPQLAAGIKSYEDGRYNQATTNFQNALTAGLSEEDEITANKYLAFISCVQGRDRQCRAYFRRALELNPAFELAPSEAGHPIWGPVFRNVKGRR